MITARRRGFSLIESAIVLAIVGLVIGGVWVAAASVSSNNKINKLMAAVEHTAIKAAEMRRQYVAYYYDGGAITKSGLIPPEMRPSANIPESCATETSYGADYCVALGGGNFAIDITYYDDGTKYYSARDCMAIAKALHQRFYKRSTQLGFYISLYNYAGSAGMTAQLNAPLNLATLASTCGNGNNISSIFVWAPQP